MTNPHHIFVNTRLHSHPYRKNFRAGQGWGKSKATQGRDRAWIPARGLVLPCRVVKFTMRDNCQFMSESAAVACTTWAITGRAWAGSSELGSSFRAAAAPIRREAARAAGPALPWRASRIAQWARGPARARIFRIETRSRAAHCQERRAADWRCRLGGCGGEERGRPGPEWTMRPRPAPGIRSESRPETGPFKLAAAPLGEDWVAKRTLS